MSTSNPISFQFSSRQEDRRSRLFRSATSGGNLTPAAAVRKKNSLVVSVERPLSAHDLPAQSPTTLEVSVCTPARCRFYANGMMFRRKLFNSIQYVYLLDLVTTERFFSLISLDLRRSRPSSSALSPPFVLFSFKVIAINKKIKEICTNFQY